MSYTTDTVSAETATYGGLVDAVGGIATVVLAIVALAGIAPARLAAVATIVFGAALLIQGGTMLSEYALVLRPRGTTATGEPGARIEHFGGSGLSSLFMMGAAGIVLGVLALLNISALQLIAIAVIAYGATLIISSNAVRQLYWLQAQSLRAASSVSGPELIAGEMASGSTGVQMLAGLTAVVLGILAVAGTDATALILVGLLVLGSTVVLTGSTLSGLVEGFMRPQTR